MDIVNPPINVIDGCYYRINALKIQSTKVVPTKPDNLNGDYFEIECEPEETECDILFENNKYVAKIDISSLFLPFIIGKRGDTKKKIEMETKTDLIIPKINNSGATIIRGDNYESVQRAINRIMLIIDTARGKLDITHFFSIPANEEVSKKFCEFRDGVLTKCLGDRGISDKNFVEPEKLHLTLGILVLGNHHEIDKAIKCFNNFKEENYDLFDEPLIVRIKGLDYFNDDPCLIHVLYGKVDDSLDCQQLQTIFVKFNEYLLQQRLITKINSKTLHMTLMKVKFEFEETVNSTESTCSDQPPIDRRFARTMDCSNVLRMYEDFDFGEIKINEIHLSKRFVETPNSFYESAQVFQLT